MDSWEDQRDGRREEGEEGDDAASVLRTNEDMAVVSWARSVEFREEKREVMILSTVPAQGTPW